MVTNIMMRQKIADIILGENDQVNIAFSITYLGYEIHDRGGADGIVLVNKGCSEANFGDLTNAKRWTLLFYLINHPEQFAHSLINKMERKGGGTYGEYVLLAETLKKEGLEMPEEVGHTNDMNRLITFNGEVI